LARTFNNKNPSVKDKKNIQKSEVMYANIPVALEQTAVEGAKTLKDPGRA
jgi:hypothetical protein